MARRRFALAARVQDIPAGRRGVFSGRALSTRPPLPQRQRTFFGAKAARAPTVREVCARAKLVPRAAQGSGAARNPDIAVRVDIARK